MNKLVSRGNLTKFRMDSPKTTRVVLNEDALSWMRSISSLPGPVVTSMPDISELKSAGVTSFLQYRDWFLF